MKLVERVLGHPWVYEQVRPLALTVRSQRIVQSHPTGELVAYFILELAP